MRPLSPKLPRDLSRFSWGYPHKEELLSASRFNNLWVKPHISPGLGLENYAQNSIRWDLWDAANGKLHGKIWTPNAHSTRNGCVTDRDQNFDTTNPAPTAGSTLNPAEQYSSCPAASVMGLSNE